MGMTAGGNYFCSMEGHLNVHIFFCLHCGEKHWTNKAITAHSDVREGG